MSLEKVRLVDLLMQTAYFTSKSKSEWLTRVDICPLCKSSALEGPPNTANREAGIGVAEREAPAQRDLEADISEEVDAETVQLLDGIEVRSAVDGAAVTASSLVPSQGRHVLPFLTQFADFDSWELAQQLVGGGRHGLRGILILIILRLYFPYLLY